MILKMLTCTEGVGGLVGHLLELVHLKKGLRDALGVLFLAAPELSREATGRPTGAWA